MAIYDGVFAVYEKLASAKLNEWRDFINSHTHNGISGAQIDYGNIVNVVITATQIPAGTITSDMILNGTITYQDIANDTIRITNIDTTSIHLSADGYAVYSP